MGRFSGMWISIWKVKFIFSGGVRCLGCNVVYFGEIPAVRRKILPSPSGQKSKPNKKFIANIPSTLLYNPQDRITHSYCHENDKYIEYN